MPPFVHLVIIARRMLSVLSWWDDRRNIALGKGVAKPTRIERAIGQQVTGLQPIQQVRHTAQVMRLPGQQAEVGKISKRICQRQNFGCDATTRLAYSLALSPPFAP